MRICVRYLPECDSHLGQLSRNERTQLKAEVIMIWIHLRQVDIRVIFIFILVSCFSGHVFAKSSVQIEDEEASSARAKQRIRSVSASSAVEKSGVERYLVTLTEAPLALYQGGHGRYEATSPQGQSKLNLQDKKSVAYRHFLMARQQQILRLVAKALARSVTPIDAFQIASNLLILPLTPAEADIVSTLPGILSVKKERWFAPQSLSERTLPKQTLPKQTLPGPLSGKSLSAIEGGGIPLKSALKTVLKTVDSRINGPYWPVGFVSMLLGVVFFYLFYRFFAKRRRVVLVIGASSTVLMMGMANHVWFGAASQVGADQVWHGADGLAPAMGEGIVIGVIDSGINPYSDSFAEVTGDGYRHENPRGKYYGVCDPNSGIYMADFPCNNKLIGAWVFGSFDVWSPFDDKSHGSHTSSDAAGNIVYGAQLETPTGLTVTQDIAGIAPRANIIAYRICKDACWESITVKSIEQAISDHVDVLNYSIGAPFLSPWTYVDAQALLAATNSGIFVAVAAGNEGPEAKTIPGVANAPWVTTVGASSQVETYRNRLVNLVNDQGDVLSDIVGESITAGFGPAAILDASDYGNRNCEKDRFSQVFHGEIILCESGDVHRLEQAKNVQANGGGGFIYYNKVEEKKDDGPGYLEADAYVIPSIHLLNSDATRLREWLKQGTGHHGEITETNIVMNDQRREVIEFYSSRGPVRAGSGESVIKPNVTVPAHAVFGAMNEEYSAAEQDYQIKHGTSVASPMVAGAAAVLKSRHPNWTPMQIQSALMTTAFKDITAADGITLATPFDIGAGRIDVASAARAALVLDESFANFQAANVATGGDPASLNIASLGNNTCIVTCSWTRKVTNVSPYETHWMGVSNASVTVTPEYFSIPPGGTRKLTFTANVTGVKFGEWYFDQVPVVSLDGRVPDAHFPMAARSSASNLPKSIHINATAATDTMTLKNRQAVEIKQAMIDIHGLAQSKVFHSALVSDPSNEDPFDGEFIPEKTGQILYRLEVPANTVRLVVEVTQSQSPDLDVFVGSGNQAPSVDTQFGESTTAGSALEYINVMNPPTGPIWIVVQNWEPGSTKPQSFTLHVAMVGEDNGTLSVKMPASQPLGESFNMDFQYKLPGSKVGDRFYGLVSVGTDAENAGNLGTTAIDLVRQ
jgi:subtilisin family serine protease